MVMTNAFKKCIVIIILGLCSNAAWCNFDANTSIYNAAECSGGGQKAAPDFEINTEKIYPDSNVLPVNNHSGLVLMCLIYICSQIHEQTVNSPELKTPSYCVWWEKVSQKIDISEEMQDLKNYLALRELEKAKHKAVSEHAEAPKQYEQLFSSIKIGQLTDSLNTDAFCSNLIFAAQNFDSIDGSILTNSGCSRYRPSVGSDFVSDHLEKFCSTIEANQGLCIQSCLTGKFDSTRGTCVYKGVENKKLLIDKPYDLMGSSLIRYTTFPDPRIQEGAKRFIETLMTMSIPKNLTPDQIFENPEAAKKGQYSFIKNKETLLAEKYNDMTLLSSVQYSLYNLYAERVPHIDDGTNLPPQNNSMGEQPPQNVDSKPPPRAMATNLSLLGTIESESTRRFKDPEWHRQIAEAGESALIKELGNMYAMQLFLNSKINEHLERLTALYAIRNSYVANRIIGDVEKARLKAEDGI